MRGWSAAVRAAVAALLLWAAPVAAQNYFGQNQVQYDRFRWRVKESDHFLVFYYPEEERAAVVATSMAERAYARLSRVLDHQFREKKPIMLFASRTDFGQNNVTGDLGEGTGGVTEAMRHRMLLNFTGDFRSFEHVLMHEMVHAFQYDIFARGKAGSGLQNLARNLPPLWFAEGMAEYLSLGPSAPLTDAWMRDAALNGKLPTIEQMTDSPNQFFPYRYGHAFWAFIGQKWGDEAIGQIMNAVPSVGVERAFRREIGTDLDDLGEEWRETMQTTHLPAVATYDRPRKFAQPLLTKKRSGGEIFLAPSLSSDGKQIAFLSNGSVARGEVFIDLWLADAETGQRIRRLVKSTDPSFEELRLLYSQSAFSPDGRFLAFTAQNEGGDVLYLMELRSRKVIRRYTLRLEGITGPTWSPDGKRLAVSGNSGGITDLYVLDVDGRNLRRLTNDPFGDLQPQWSPDGQNIAFATDRSGADTTRLRFSRWSIATVDVTTGTVTVLPGQRGLNTNPQWSPDGKSLAYVSDRSGTANVFLWDADQRDHFRLTNVVGAISAITEYSPSISWARGADRLAFTYFENGDYTIWQVNNPRSLKRSPYRDTVVTVTAQSALDSSVVLAATRSTVSIAALLDSADLALPDPSRFEDYSYRVRFQPDYVARPSIGYAPDSYRGSVFGGTTVILSDMLGNHRLAIAGEINGRVGEALLFFGYSNLSRRLQHTTAFAQTPLYFLSNDSLIPTGDPQVNIEKQEITTYVARQFFSTAAYPLNRHTRVELGAGVNVIARQRLFLQRAIRNFSLASQFTIDSTRRDPGLNYAEATLAWVSDNTLQGDNGPLLGRRYRAQISPVIGGLQWVEYVADYRRYDAVIFNYLTFATRVFASVSDGPDETQFMKYVARPDYVRGYDRNNLLFQTCPVVGASSVNCSATQLLGSRVAVANAELRFPLVRRLELGVLPITLPPVDGLFFFDAGVAWSRGQTVYGVRPGTYDAATQRYPLRSYGFGVRMNLYNYAMLRWDFAVPLDRQGGRRGFWTWSLWPSF
ncbi:MAG: BamA/TamA family outer membrane protein [Gemmatimonadota bacterium]